MAQYTTKGRTQPPSRQVDPPTQKLAVTPSDSTDLVWLPRIIKVGVGGLVRLWLDGDPTNNASGLYTISSGSGTLHAVIDSVDISVVWATSDINTATLLAAAINANVTLLAEVIATNTYVAADGTTTATNIVTVTYLNPSPAGDAITTTASGTGISVAASTLLGSAGTYTEYLNTGVDYLRVIRRVLSTSTTAESIRVFR